MRLIKPLLLLAIPNVAALSQAANGQISPLPVIDQELRTNFPGVGSIKAGELQALLNGKKPLIILDVREKEEFAVSHVQGAARIDPDAELADVLRIIGSDIKGRTIIVYCSVGVRSTELADRIRDGLIAKGARRITNLSEGIFGWHNGRRLLMRGAQATPYVHPYDARWGRLLLRQDLAAYAPVTPGNKPAIRGGFNEAILNHRVTLIILSLLALAACLRFRRKLFGGQKS
jgi:rhodanese-related sulfurtransferase